MHTHFASKLKDIERWQNNRNLNQASKDDFAFSSSYKLQTMSAIIDLLEINNFTEDYDQEVIKIRNKFAHAVLEEDQVGRKFFRKGGLTFDQDLCRNIRQNIAKHDANLAMLLGLVKLTD